MRVPGRLLAALVAAAILVTAGTGPGKALDPGPPADPKLQQPTTTSPSAKPPMSPSVQVTGTGYDARYPDVAYNSQYDEYMVVWVGNYKVLGRRVSSRGDPIGSEFEIASVPTRIDGRPKIAYDARRNRYLVIWGRSAGLVYHMYGRFVDWGGPKPAWPAFLIDASRPASTSYYAVANAHTQDEFLVVWAAETQGSTRLGVTGRRVRADGSGFPETPFWIATHGSDNRQNPDVAYNLHRNEYLVVYDDHAGGKVNETIFGTRLAGNAAVLGGGEFGITHWIDDEIEPSVAACHAADQYLVVWHSIQIAPLDDGVYARIVTGAGAPTVVKTIVHYDWWRAHMPVDVACGVTGLLMEDPHYLVTWDNALDFSGTIRAREVSTIGSLSDAFEIDDWSGPAALAGGKINHLAAWDTNGADSDGFSDIYARIVGNTRPEAKFTVSPTEGDSTTVFQFDATTSSDWTDPNEQLQVRWDWNNDGSYDTPWTHTRTASHQFVLEPWTSMEVKIVRLEVTDGHEVSDTATKDVTIRNASPTAAFTISPSSGDTNTSFTFDASASSDPEGGTLHTSWDWDDDGTFDTPWSENLTASHTFPSPGTYTVRLKLGDYWEQTDTTTRQVTVQPGSANTPPQATFTITPASGDTSTVFTFDASGSTDAEDGSPTHVCWDWNNDGTPDTPWSTTKTAQHTFTTAGNHSVRLDVKDSGGLSDDATKTVPVGGAPPGHEIYLPLSLRTFGWGP